MDILVSGETIKQIKSLSTISLSRNTTVSTGRRTNRQCLSNKIKIKKAENNGSIASVSQILYNETISHSNTKQI